MALPIENHLPEILEAFANSPRVLVEAEPGAGKSTVVPLELMKFCTPTEKIILLQPRRLAAKNLATHLAHLAGVKLGTQVGYQVRGESKQSKETQLLVMTQGIFLRQALEDPELKDVKIVLMDEFHERHLDGDFILALLQDIQEVLREDLKLGILSATLDSAKLQELLNQEGLSCQRCYSQGRSYPVQVEHQDIDPNELKRFSVLVNQMATHALKTIQRLESGHLLCFLPGVGEIQATRQEIQERLQSLDINKSVEIHELHGSIPLHAQSKILEESPHQKIILSTNVAESSLTVPGVRAVIDCGLEKVARWNPARDSQTIDLELCSQASATQRQGRAGRTSEGICIKLWPKRVDQWRRPYQEASILREDLVLHRLMWKNWGEDRCSSSRFLDVPKEGFWRRATEILGYSGLLSPGGELTPLAEATRHLSVDPRLLGLFWQEELDSTTPVRWYLCGLLTEAVWPTARTPQALESLFEQKYLPKQVQLRIAQWEKQFKLKWKFPQFKPELITELLLNHYINRLSWKQNRQYTQVCGVGLHNEELLPDGFISLAQSGKNLKTWVYHPIDKSDLEPYLETKIHLGWVDDKWRAQLGLYVDELAVETRPCSLPQGEELQRALWGHWTRYSETDRSQDEAQQWLHPFWRGFHISESDIRFLNRLFYYFQSVDKDSCQDVLLKMNCDWQDLQEVAHESFWRKRYKHWLESYISSIQEMKDVSRLELSELWSQALGYDFIEDFKRQVPTHWKASQHRSFALEYSGVQVKLSVRLQELLGLSEHPQIGGQALLIELLSPARRPIQLTQDLAGFWRGSYAEVRKEMKGRYPKHSWPEDPLHPES